jgi:hypothetical protein
LLLSIATPVFPAEDTQEEARRYRVEGRNRYP